MSYNNKTQKTGLDFTVQKNSWDERLEMCMKQNGYTQTSLSKAIREKYDTSTSQTNISR